MQHLQNNPDLASYTIFAEYGRGSFIIQDEKGNAVSCWQELEAAARLAVAHLYRERLETWWQDIENNAAKILSSSPFPSIVFPCPLFLAAAAMRRCEEISQDLSWEQPLPGILLHAEPEWLILYYPDNPLGPRGERIIGWITESHNVRPTGRWIATDMGHPRDCDQNAFLYVKGLRGRIEEVRSAYARQ